MSPSVYDDLDIEVQREGSVRFAIRQAEAGDTKYLLSLLNEPVLPEALRVWLSGLFDPRSDTDFVAKIRRRRPGKPPKIGYEVAAAAHDVVSNLASDFKLESLVQLAIEKYSVRGRRQISRSSIFDYLGSRWPDLKDKLREASGQNNPTNCTIYPSRNFSTFVNPCIF